MSGNEEEAPGELSTGLVKRVSAVKKRSAPFATSFWGYFWGLAGVILIFVFQQILRLTYDTSSKKSRVKMHKSMNKIWHGVGGKLWVDWNPFWERVVKYDIPKDEIQTPVIIMSNHLSFSDALFYTGVFDFDVVAVAKDDLWKAPLFGTIVRNNGFLPVFFKKKKNGKWTTDKEQLDFMMRKAEEKLADGVSISIAPEGTIPADGQVGEFKPGFFRLGLKTNTPVLPTACWGNQKAWPMGPKDARGYVNAQAWLYPARSCITVGHPVYPIEPSEFKEGELYELIQNCINDSTNSLTAEDFAGEDTATLGLLLWDNKEESESAHFVYEALLDSFIQRTRNKVIEMVDKLKVEYEEYEKEIEEAAAESEIALAKRISQIASTVVS